MKMSHPEQYSEVLKLLLHFLMGWRLSVSSITSNDANDLLRGSKEAIELLRVNGAVEVGNGA